MKKVLAGCLVIAVIAGVGVAVASFFLYRAARPLLDEAVGYVGGLARFAELEDLEDAIEAKGRYEPPAGGELMAAQVTRFVSVQRAVHDALGARFENLREHHAQLGDRDSARDLSTRELLAALSDLAAVIVDARRVQVDELNRQRFSQAEYLWVRGQVYRAAGLEVVGAVDLSEMVRIAREGADRAGIATPDVPSAGVPERNRALVRPHAERLREWMPLAFFGL